MDEATRAAVEQLRQWVNWEHLLPMNSERVGDLGTVLDALDRLAPLAPLLEIVERCESAEQTWLIALDHDCSERPYSAETRIGDGEMLSSMPGPGHYVRAGSWQDAIAALSAALAETDGTEAGR